MRILIRLAGCFVLLLFWQTFSLTAVFGQQAINGFVHEQQSDNIISAAVIKITGDKLIKPIETSSDIHGRFFVGQLDPGHYQVEISHDGYQPMIVEINLALRARPNIDAGLNPLPVVSAIVDVFPTESRLETVPGGSLAVSNAEFINNLPLQRRNNLPDLISALVPSAVASHDNFVHVRGNELSLNTSVNGVTFIDNPHQYFAPGFEPGVIKSFNVITGDFAAEYGNRFGGIIDAVTRSGFDSDHGGALTIGLGNYHRETASLEFGGHGKRLGYFFLFERQSLRSLYQSAAVKRVS